MACLQNSDCPAGQVCDPVQNVCLQVSATTCTTEKDCASNTAAPHCKPGSNGKPGVCVACVNDTQCAAGEVCSSNTCVVKQCLADADCAAPTPRCLIGATPQVCVACLGNPDCPNGGTCQSDHTCVAASGCAACKPPTPACKNNTCVACVQPSDCAPGETCSPQNTCVSTKCTSDNDLNELKAHVDKLAARISQVTEEYTKKIEQRLRERRQQPNGAASQPDGHEQIVRFYDPVLVVKLTDAMTRDAAIPRLVRPWAISAVTSRSRGVRGAVGVPALDAGLQWRHLRPVRRRHRLQERHGLQHDRAHLHRHRRQRSDLQPR